MQTAIGNLAVNAAFLQEIKEDNRELQALLNDTSEIFGQPRPASRPRQLAGKLAQLRDMLAMHFTLEEAFGYFEDALDVAPRLSARADLLRAEHQQLYLRICEIADEAEQLLYHEKGRKIVMRMAEQFREFHRRLREHESRENELILEAFDDDIGVGD